MDKFVWNKNNKFAPFRNGSLLGYAENYPNYEMKNVAETFNASLILKSCERGRSAVNIIWEDIHTKCKYPMFLKRFMEIVLSNGINHPPIINGEWRVIKQGINYGIELVKIHDNVS